MPLTRRRQPSPFQRALFPGSQDDDRPPSKEQPPKIQYGRVPAWFLAASPSNAALRLYTFAACTFANRQRLFWHKETVLAEKCGQSVRSTQRAVAELVRLGALTVTPRYGRDGRQVSNLYQLHFQAPAASDRSSEAHDFVTGGVTELSAPGDNSVTGPPSIPDSAQVQLQNANQTHVTRPTPFLEPDGPSALQENISDQRESLDHHHQGLPALSAPDDDDEHCSDLETSETCQGPDVEARSHAHRTPDATARHLELFLGHAFARRFVQTKGVELVNDALEDLDSQRGVRNPAGWIVSRVDELQRGSGGGLSVEDGRPVNRYQLHLKEYQRRWSGSDETVRWSDLMLRSRAADIAG